MLPFLELLIPLQGTVIVDKISLYEAATSGTVPVREPIIQTQILRLQVIFTWWNCLFYQSAFQELFKFMACRYRENL